MFYSLLKVRPVEIMVDLTFKDIIFFMDDTALRIVVLTRLFCLRTKIRDTTLDKGTMVRLARFIMVKCTGTIRLRRFEISFINIAVCPKDPPESDSLTLLYHSDIMVAFLVNNAAITVQFAIFPLT